MVINHNMSAIYANRQLGVNGLSLSKDMEKLSSGERINRAGDDASGLAVSEKMRAQIRGLNQASQNASNGISFIQTTEGYLQETTDIMQRIRELAVQSSNGIYSEEDRMQIQVEISALVSEVDRIKDIEQEVKEELARDGISIGNPKTGIMIETPAAVMIRQELAKKVDFFSIGTNDLTQYTLAIDRQNSNLDEFYDSHHPAVLEMIRMVVDNAHKEGIWAGICGELGADTTLTKEFLSMGVDELSVSAGKLLAIRKIIRETDTSKIKAGE